MQEKLRSVLDAVSQEHGLEYKSNQKSIKSMMDKATRKSTEDIDYDLSSLKRCNTIGNIGKGLLAGAGGNSVNCKTTAWIGTQY